MKRIYLSHFTLFQATLFIVLFITFAGTVIAWSGPSATAPGNNVAAPINVGATSQIKNGALGANSLAVYGNGYVQGSIGIGVVSPQDTLDVKGSARITGGTGSPAYLRIDQTANSGKIWRVGNTGVSSSFTSFDIYNQTDNINALSITSVGNVGIGTTQATNALTVDGADTSSAMVLYSNKSYGSFSVLPWSGGSYIGSGVYYNNGTWVTDSPNGTNSLLQVGPTGASWYASNNGTASWNVASAVPLWNNQGQLCVGGVCRSSWPSGGISDVTTAYCYASGGSCTATCPAGYFRTGCDVDRGQIATPVGNNGCYTGNTYSQVYAYCAR